MTFSRSVAWIGGLTLAAAWLASAAGIGRQQRAVRVPPPASDADQVVTLAADVQTQATRLRQRLSSAPAPQSPTRNPFTFAERQVPPARVRMPAIVDADDLDAAPVAEAEPHFSLIGVAEQQTPVGVVRTAMIAGPSQDDLHMVTAGQSLGDRYHVVAVSADAVELRDLHTGAVRRLALQ